MIKAVLRKGEKGTLVILGLSRLNTQRLLEGKPIPIDLKNELGVEVGDGPLTLLIMGGETEESIKQELSKHAKLPEVV